jgi:hypothetical protein
MGHRSTSGGTGTRTPDPLHAMQVLYQLSYTPKGLSMLPVDSRATEFEFIHKSFNKLALGDQDDAFESSVPTVTREV